MIYLIVSASLFIQFFLYLPAKFLLFPTEKKLILKSRLYSFLNILQPLFDLFFGQEFGEQIRRFFYFPTNYH